MRRLHRLLQADEDARRQDRIERAPIKVALRHKEPARSIEGERAGPAIGRRGLDGTAKLIERALRACKIGVGDVAGGDIMRRVLVG